ncbi:hypothetical protein [Psychrobacillus sp.]|uniref:hypothetical protein n=1 Tax=Psychrobacillus sp. TaxID=1871623 RepID=UPI0028BF29F4|nr:hypothetical protein [Psychrobacillus sp.]
MAIYNIVVPAVIERGSQVTQVPAVKERLNMSKEVVEDHQAYISQSSNIDARIIAVAVIMLGEKVCPHI